jgi:hypothetical protein
MEVGYIGGKEVYSWPGASRFEEKGLEQLVGVGMTSTGDFAGHVRNLFVNNSAQITFAGQPQLRGRNTFKYDFRIPFLSSGWTLQSPSGSGRVSATGSFWADAQTQLLLRLDINAQEIPPELLIASVHTQIEYGRVRLDASDVLLPQRAETIMVGSAGLQDRNDIEFTHCHSYVAQSEISFHSEPKEQEAKSANVEGRETALPPNLIIRIQLEAPIDSKTATEGDPIVARSQADVKWKNQILLPKGSVVRGRIRRLESYDHPRPYYIVGLEFTEIEVGDKRYFFAGRLEQFDPIPGISSNITDVRKHTSLESTGPNIYVDGQQTVSGASGSILTETQIIETRDLPGVGTVFIDGTSFRIDKFHMQWRTIAERKP